MRLAELDPDAILSTLGIEPGALLLRVSGGSDTALWRVECPGGVYALRVFRPDQAEMCCREVLAMRTAAAGGVPTPAVQAEARWQGHPALLLSWCNGQPLAAALHARPGMAHSLGRAFGREQARIHTLAAPEGLRGWEAAWSRWLGSDERVLLERLRTVATGSGTLLHLDYHPLNVMVDHGQVTGVLDWANAAAGDPRLDLARTITILRLVPTLRDRPRRLSRVLWRAFELGWRQGYQQAGGHFGGMAVCCATAGAIMERDLAAKVGAADIERVRRWTLAWKQRIDTRG